MPYRFPSEEWIQEFGRQLNASESYERSGKAWEGDFLFIVEADEGLSQAAYFYLDLFHGKSRESALLAGVEGRQTAYTLSAPFQVWRKVIEGRLDPIQGLMTRRLKLKGDLLQVMRYPKAAKDMVDCVMRVPTEWPPAESPAKS